MKRIFRSIMACLLAIVMTVGSAPLTGLVGLELPDWLDFSNLFWVEAEAATYSGSCGDNLTWTLDELTGELVICGTGEMDEGYVPWKSNRLSIRTVNIKNGVTTIGSGMFAGCSNLINITFPDSLVSIGSSAFSECDSLTEVVIPEGIENISNSMFYGCNNLSSVVIPNSVTNIGDNAFGYCYPLKNIEIPTNVVSIGDRAFEYCNLSNVSLSENIKSIGLRAFNCYTLETISVDKDNLYFSSDENGVLFDKNKTKIFQYPKDNKNTEYTIPDSVTCILDYAFYDCDKLESIIMSDNISSVSYSAFNYCDNLNVVRYKGSSSLWSSVSVSAHNENLTNNLLFECSSDEPYFGKGECTETISWIINVNGELVLSGTGDIPNYHAGMIPPWYNARLQIKKILISPEATSIGDYAFVDCERLLEAKVPNSVTKIGDYAFAGCMDLANITLGNNVAVVGDYAFMSCFDLSTITILNNSIDIGKDAIYERSYVCCNTDSSAHIYAKQNDLKYFLLDCNIVKKPTQTTISYGDSIILHADMNEALPSGWTVKWTADNGNFSYSANGETCTVTPSKSGDTTFTATVYDENGNEISKDTQTMKSKAGFFDKFAAFFRKLFGMTKIIQQSINF